MEENEEFADIFEPGQMKSFTKATSVVLSDAEQWNTRQHSQGEGKCLESVRGLGGARLGIVHST